MEVPAAPCFATLFLDRHPPVEAAAGDLLRWCRHFHESGFAGTAGAKAGNLSVRLAPGFLVTPTGLPLDRVGAEDLVRVVEVRLEARTLLVVGRREPSVEALLHHRIYARRPDVGAVFHGHADRLLRQGPALGLRTTPREAPSGSLELAEMAAEVAAGGVDVVLLREHGFVTLGADAEAAGGQALDLLALLAR